MKVRLTIIVTLLILILASYATAAPSKIKKRSWIDALAMQESGNKPIKPHKDSNGQIVVGYFQISKPYWLDAARHDPSLKANGGSWELCETDRDYGIRVVNSYMDLYNATTPEMKSRTHNGGPMYDKNGNIIKWKMKATDHYWADIKAWMGE
jgi:hypothetical protein